MTTIDAINYALPDRRLTNAELAREHPGWRMERVVERTGITSRRVVTPDETAFDLSVRACEALAECDGVDLDRADAILYCTQSPDYRMPGNAHLLHRRLGLGDRVLAFDYSLACSGYVYGLAMADAFLRTRLCSRVLLITAETTTKLISQGDRATASLFGDGAAATYLSMSGSSGGTIAASRLCTNGAGFKGAYIPAGAARTPSSEQTQQEWACDRHGSVRALEDAQMDGPALWAFINSEVSCHVKEFLADQGLTMDDVDLCIFHQASKLVLDSLAKALSIEDEKKLFVYMRDVGNLSSASIPVALHTALGQGAIATGNRVLLTGFGAGLSYGSVLLEF